MLILKTFYSGMTNPVFMKNASDNRLIAAYKSADNIKALEILFQRYRHIVFGVCMKYLKNRDESEDAAMEIFGTLIYDLKKHEIQNFRIWLYYVTRNHCLKKKQKSNRLKIVYKEPHELESTIMENVDFDDLTNERKGRLQKALNQLNEAQKTCIQLFYFEKKSYKDIAAIKKINVSRVKSYIQNGKRNLKKIILSMECLSGLL